MANNKYPNTQYYNPNCEWLLQKLQEAVEILEQPEGRVPEAVKNPYYDLIAAAPSTVWDEWNLNEIIETYNNLNNVPRDKALEWARNTYGRLYAQYTGDHTYEAQLFPVPSILNKIEPATSDTLGGIKADPKTDQDVTPVHIGPDDKLYVAASEYELPQATDITLGGVRAMERGPLDTQDVTIDPDTGMLYTAPGGAGAGHIVSKTPPEDTDLLWVDPDDDTTGTFDTELSSTSTNAVENQAVTKALEGKIDKDSLGYKLIKHIELTEGGTIYEDINEKSLYITLTVPANTSDYVNLLLYTEEEYVVVYMRIMPLKTTATVWAQADIIDGKTRIWFTNGAFPKVEDLCLSFVSPKETSSNYTQIFVNHDLPKGTKVDIYGRDT